MSNNFDIWLCWIQYMFYYPLKQKFPLKSLKFHNWIKLAYIFLGYERHFFEGNCKTTHRSSIFPVKLLKKWEWSGGELSVGELSGYRHRLPEIQYCWNWFYCYLNILKLQIWVILAKQESLKSKISSVGANHGCASLVTISLKSEN